MSTFHFSSCGSSKKKNAFELKSSLRFGRVLKSNANSSASSVFGRKLANEEK